LASPCISRLTHHLWSTMILTSGSAKSGFILILSSTKYILQDSALESGVWISTGWCIRILNTEYWMLHGGLISEACGSNWLTFVSVSHNAGHHADIKTSEVAYFRTCRPPLEAYPFSPLTFLSFLRQALHIPPGMVYQQLWCDGCLRCPSTRCAPINPTMLRSSQRIIITPVYHHDLPQQRRLRH
jgi:hypothetical protein